MKLKGLPDRNRSKLATTTNERDNQSHSVVRIVACVLPGHDFTLHGCLSFVCLLGHRSRLQCLRRVRVPPAHFLLHELHGDQEEQQAGSERMFSKRVKEVGHLVMWRNGECV